MTPSKTLVTTAISSLLALGLTTAVTTAQAEDNEKCYGISKAGKNDCQTANSSCAGTSVEDNQADAWVYVPKGLCEKIVGGSLEASS